MGGALRGVACLMPAPVEWFLQAACCLTLKKEACTVFLAEPSCALPFTLHACHSAVQAAAVPSCGPIRRRRLRWRSWFQQNATSLQGEKSLGGTPPHPWGTHSLPWQEGQAGSLALLHCRRLVA